MTKTPTVLYNIVMTSMRIVHHKYNILGLLAAHLLNCDRPHYSLPRSHVHTGEGRQEDVVRVKDIRAQKQTTDEG